jgi:glucose-6-phosphate isomerase
MIINLEKISGLPLEVDSDTCTFILGKDLNEPSYRVRMLHDLDAVWANPVPDFDRVIYQYTSGLWLEEDEVMWKKANIIYGVVVFVPGRFAGEYNKSSGQYHPIIPPNTMGSPEVYSVFHGTGHFLLQKSIPPYDTIQDAVLVEVQPGESFIIPPDYGHLQINPGNEPLIFSYAAMDGMHGVYEPFRKTRGAIYYEIANGMDSKRFVIKAGEICQMPFLNEKVTYQKIRDNLEQFEFLTNPEKFPEHAGL